MTAQSPAVAHARPYLDPQEQVLSSVVGLLKPLAGVRDTETGVLIATGERLAMVITGRKGRVAASIEYRDIREVRVDQRAMGVVWGGVGGHKTYAFLVIRTQQTTYELGPLHATVAGDHIATAILEQVPERGDDPLERSVTLLRSLAALRAEGLLTEDEYVEKKAKILSRFS